MIIFEDDYIIAVNKPNNILVHHSKMANNRLEEKSLVQLLFDKYALKFYPIHRLDRKTSGLILFAKQKEFVFKFQQLFIEGKMLKTYFGLVRGFTEKTGIINSDVKGRDALVYKTALTNYTRLQTIEMPIEVKPYKNSRYSLLKLEPKTGRLHQLRIHLNKISHPLIGDPKYGDRFHNSMFAEKFDCKKMFLHAKVIDFRHPFTSKNIKIVAEFPEDWLLIATKFHWNL